MILVVGCGYVGKELAQLLHEAGEVVCGLTHSTASAEQLSEQVTWQVRAVDISDAQAVQALADALPPVQAVVHCASSSGGGEDAYEAVYQRGMQHLLENFPRAFPVFTSSTSVYAQTDGSVVDETSPAEPGKRTGQILRATEERTLAHGGSVLRLAGIYGPHRSFVLRNLLLGKSGVEGEDGLGRFLNQIHRLDAARALAHLLQQKQGGIWNGVDDEPMLQGHCLRQLAALFSMRAPGSRAPDPSRKRGWTHKAVSNAKLKASGWSPIYPNYFHAIQKDPTLVSSILDEIDHETPEAFPRADNMILIGLMGSGKSTVGKIIARQIGWEFVDLDSLIVEQAQGKSIPDIFAAEGEAGFRQRESSALRSLLGCHHTVIATGGGVVMTAHNLAWLKHLGFVIWLDAPPALLSFRTSFSNDRPLLQNTDAKARLTELNEQRAPIYRTLADLRIQTHNLTPDESAYGICESARVFFSEQIQRRLSNPVS